jgi:hypothetical protein
MVGSSSGGGWQVRAMTDLIDHPPVGGRRLDFEAPFAPDAGESATARSRVSTLTDNGAVYTSHFTGGRNGFEYLLAYLGIRQKNGAPGQPRLHSSTMS